MKKFIVVIVLLIAFQLHGKAQSITSINFSPSTKFIALGGRQWIDDVNGWEIQAGTDWKFNDLIARVKYMRSLYSDENKKYYALATVGYIGFKEKSDEMTFSASAPSFAVGGGAEFFITEKKNKAVAIELGYQYGKATANYTSMGYEFEFPFKLPPLYIGGAFSIYFNK